MLPEKKGNSGGGRPPDRYVDVTIILQSSVGTLEGHSEVGVYLASFCVPN